MKSSSNIRPAIIQPLGNGAYYYNYNIVERKETTPDTGTADETAEDGSEVNSLAEERIVYDYDTVKVWDYPTYEKLAKAVIRAKVDETEEFSIINEYNAGQLGLTSDEDKAAAYAAYTDYLQFVIDTKAMVKADLAAAGY